MAGLTGERWLEFLDKSGDTDQFTCGPGRLLITAPYERHGVIGYRLALGSVHELGEANQSRYKSMLQFVWLWALLLLPLPILVRWLMPKSDEILPSLKTPFFSDVSRRGLTGEAPSNTSIVLATIVWLAMIFALTRPLWVEESIDVPISGRDILLALDASASMDQQDFSQSALSRFDVVKRIAGRFRTQASGRSGRIDTVRQSTISVRAINV